MTQHTPAEIVLVFPLYFRHRQKTVDQIRAPARARMTRGSFILDDVSAFKSAGPIHRREPPAYVTQHSEHSTNHRGPNFADPVWTRTKTLEHFADQLSMVPFLVFNGLDVQSFRWIIERMPVPPVRVARRQFARICHLQRGY